MERIAVAVDPEDRPDVLLAHGLKLALHHKAVLTVCVIDPSGSEGGTWGRLPGVGRMLAAWGLIPSAEDTQAFHDLGLEIKPLEAPSSDVATALLKMLAAREPDLLIMGTHGRVGLERMVQGSVAERVSRGWHGPTLVLGPQAGVVDVATGALSVPKALLPVAPDLGTQYVVDTLVRVLDGVGVEACEVHALKVGEVDMPLVTFPEPERWGWHGHAESGGRIVDRIVGLAQELDVALIAMGTHGHDDWFDAVAGSHTERVMRRAPCAVLTVPMT